MSQEGKAESVLVLPDDLSYYEHLDDDDVANLIKPIERCIEDDLSAEDREKLKSKLKGEINGWISVADAMRALRQPPNVAISELTRLQDVLDMAREEIRDYDYAICVELDRIVERASGPATLEEWVAAYPEEKDTLWLKANHATEAPLPSQDARAEFARACAGIDLLIKATRARIEAQLQRQAELETKTRPRSGVDVVRQFLVLRLVEAFKNAGGIVSKTRDGDCSKFLAKVLAKCEGKKSLEPKAAYARWVEAEKQERERAASGAA